MSFVPGFICALPSTSDGLFIGKWASSGPDLKFHPAFLTTCGSNCCKLGSFGSGSWEGEQHAGELLGNNFGINTCRREGRKTGLGRGTSCAALHFQRKIQLTLQWALKPVWPFRVVPSWGSGGLVFTSCVVRNVTLSKEKSYLCPQLLWCHH